MINFSRKNSVAVAVIVLLWAGSVKSAQTETSWFLTKDGAQTLAKALNLKEPLEGLRLSLRIKRVKALVTGRNRKGEKRLAITLMRAQPAVSAMFETRGTAIRPVPGPAPKKLVRAIWQRLEASGLKIPWQRPASSTTNKGPSTAKTGKRLDINRLIQLVTNKNQAQATAMLETLKGQLDIQEGLYVVWAWTRIGDLEKAEQTARHLIAKTDLDKILIQVALGKDVADSKILASIHSKWCEKTELIPWLRVIGKDRTVILLARAIVKHDPKCRSGWAKLIRNSRRVGMIGLAIRTAKEALARFPQNHGIWLDYAQTMHTAHRFTESYKWLMKFVLANPYRSGSLGELAAVVNSAPDVFTERHWEQQIFDNLRKDPMNPVFRFLAGVFLHYEYQFKRSNALLRPLLATPLFREPRVQLYIAMNDYNLGWPQKAMDRLEWASMMTPQHDPDLFYCMAEIQRNYDRDAAYYDLTWYIVRTENSLGGSKNKIRRVKRMLKRLEECMDQHIPVCDSEWEHPKLVIGIEHLFHPCSVELWGPDSPCLLLVEKGWPLIAGMALMP